jgi:hypothetical protein
VQQRLEDPIGDAPLQSPEFKLGGLPCLSDNRRPKARRDGGTEHLVPIPHLEPGERHSCAEPVGEDRHACRVTSQTR